MDAYLGLPKSSTHTKIESWFTWELERIIILLHFGFLLCSGLKAYNMFFIIG
jgi:hypothetical protein